MKSPAEFVPQRGHLAYERDRATAVALVHLININDAENFAFMNREAIDDDLFEQLVESDPSVRWRIDWKKNYIPVRDNDLAVLLAIIGVKIFRRDTLRTDVLRALRNLRNA